MKTPPFAFQYSAGGTEIQGAHHEVRSLGFGEAPGR